MFTGIAVCVLFGGMLLFFTGRTRLFFCLFVLLGGGIFAHLATSYSMGAESFGKEEAMSLRQDSVGSRRGFFVYVGGRSHMGGGLAGGK